MEINQIKITVRELVDGYKDSGEEGVVGYGGLLDIRPPYQREFIYNEKESQAVIDSVLHGFPLNSIYWAAKPNGFYEVLDGQQRILSICRYTDRKFSFKMEDGTILNYYNLPDDLRARILDYELNVYLCDGAPSEKLKWFEIINIAAKPLKTQELLNAVYSGQWITDAKRYFSKNNPPAAGYRNAGELLKGSPIRQDYLETVLKWISGNNVESYMDARSKEKDATELWTYFQEVINWVRLIFPDFRAQMCGLQWGEWYNSYRDKQFDPKKLETQVASMMSDVEVQKKPGIYAYLITGDEKYLNLRGFDAAQRAEAYERQKGICGHCKEHFAFAEMEADHITPWSAGGKTVPENCQMLCVTCNRKKGNK